MFKCFNPYSPGFSIYLKSVSEVKPDVDGLQSLFTWIFYLFIQLVQLIADLSLASILIHLDFLSIYSTKIVIPSDGIGFNPYSPGFSIYFDKYTFYYANTN